MQDEYDSLILNGVWVLVLLSHVLATGAKIISGKWVWKNKLGELGQVLKMCERYQGAKAAGDDVDDPKLYTVKPVRPQNG